MRLLLLLVVLVGCAPDPCASIRFPGIVLQPKSDRSCDVKSDEIRHKK